MKRLSPVLLIAFASTAIIAAAPPAISAPEQILNKAYVSAPSPERLSLARQYIAQTESTEDTIALMRASAFRVASAYLPIGAGEDQRSAARARVSRLLIALEPAVRAGLPPVMDAYVQAYASEFSADELKQLILFSQTLTGKHYLSRYSYMESDPAVLAAQQDLAKTLKPIMENIEKQACAAKAAVRVAAGDKNAKCPLAG